MDVGTLHQLIENRVNMPVNLPPHITRRLHALLGDDEPTFCDAKMTIGDKTYTGAVTIFTAKRVLTASFTDTPKHDGDEKTYTVDVSTWSRRALTRLDIDANVSLGANPDNRWSQQWSNWPANAFIKVTFEGQNPLTLPMTDSPANAVYDELAELVASLTADLS